MTPDEWASEYERQKRERDKWEQFVAMAQRINTQDKRTSWRKQLVPGTVPARSADELIERMGFAVSRKS